MTTPTERIFNFEGFEGGGCDLVAVWYGKREGDLCGYTLRFGRTRWADYFLVADGGFHPRQDIEHRPCDCDESFRYDRHEMEKIVVPAIDNFLGADNRIGVPIRVDWDSAPHRDMGYWSSFHPARAWDWLGGWFAGDESTRR